MKTTNLWKWSVGLSLAVLPFLGCGQRSPSTNPAPAIVQNTTVVAPVTAEDEAAAEQTENQLENAPAQVVSTAAVPTNSISAAAAEIVKLAQAGVDEGVMMAFVTNSSNAFQLSSDNVVYLSDVGVPSAVVTAMIQRDQALGLSSPANVAAAEPPPTNPLVPAPGAPTPYATAQPTQTEAAQVAEQVVPAPQPQQVNVSYTYFYDSLSPYGTWIDVDGYGLCWQPTVVVVNRDWQPYVHHGRWVYSDCGWYWTSDYSWGWAPFHYGRWFRHARWGWCWAPDTVWGPAWVSWRYSSDYCGWAPLPPTACYRPGFGFTYYGRSVGFSFGFGLSWNRYCFVPVRNLCDRHVYHHRLPDHHVRTVYHNTQPIHRYDRDDRNRIINRGIPVEQVRAVTRTDIRPIPTRDTDRPTSPRFERGDRDNMTRLAVYRPQLPQPEGPTRLVGEGVRPADRRTITRNVNTAAPAGSSMGSTSGGQRPERTRLAPRTIDRRGEQTTPVVRNTPSTAPAAANQPAPDSRAGSGRNLQPPRTIGSTDRQADRRTEPLIIRGPNRGNASEQTATTGGSSTPQANVRGNNDRDITRTPEAVTPPPVRTVQPWNSGSAAQATTPTRQIPSVRQQQPSQFQNPPPKDNQRIYRTESPRMNAPRIITPSAPAPQQSLPQVQPTPRNYQPSVPAYQPPRSIEQPRYVAPEPRMPSRSEAPVRTIEPRQNRDSSPSVRQSAPAPSRSQPDRGSQQRDTSSRNEGRRGR